MSAKAAKAAGSAHFLNTGGKPMTHTDQRPNYFDADVAAHYDAAEAAMFAPEVITPTVDMLAELAGTGRALEFAIGTGRVALPLVARGIPVSGIEYSTAMIAVLAGKPGAGAIEVVQGDMATTRVAGMFRLVYLVFNTIGNLTTQDEQVVCFQNAAAHLEPGGSFLVEVCVPQLRLLTPGTRAIVSDHGPHHTCIDTYDPVAQLLQSDHFTREADGRFRYGFTPHRYVWPAELDLMARIAGLHLVHRWADWTRRPFSADSEKHISVWQKPT
jgi:SAM-dependent methyltransferase